MLTYTGPWPFRHRGDDDPIMPGDTVPESHADYAYLQTRGDFAAVPVPPSVAIAPSTPTAPKTKKTPKKATE